ncbi:hypothetical protein AB1Y20_003914 [Prymnesium parvum]|uniref:Uncharacterized protein n=1 Tax=Prymnesium parvum TaxID=97485 RepID=A0AB34J6A6_PRYPA
MFATADWTNPKVGGLLNEVIMKEERQAREPKPRVEVKHVWDPEALASRESIWRETKPRMNSTLVKQNAGTQMRTIFDGRPEKLSSSSRVIGSDPLCQAPPRSRYARQKPFPDPAIRSYNNPNRLQVERLQKEILAAPRPWRSEPVSCTLPALVPRSTVSSFCVRPGEIPLGP